MKKVLSFIFALVLIFTIIPAGSFSAEALTWKKYTTTTLWLDVTKNNAPVRAGNVEKSNVVNYLASGSIIKATGYGYNSSNNLWYKVSGGYIYSGNVTIHSNHKYSNYTTTKSPTCMSTGTVTGTCVCGKTYSYSTGTVSHSYDTKTFMCTYGCGKCNPNSITVTSTAKNTLYVHTDVTSKTGPYTATKTINSYKKGTKLTSVAIVKNGYGNVWYKLSDGYYVYESYVTVHNSHTWNSGSITKSATCTADGTKKYTCTLCGATKTATITKLGHKWNSGKKTKSPTCSATGTMKYTCVRCSVTKTESIAKVSHNYDTKTFMCTYGCGKCNPNSITVTSNTQNTLYVHTDVTSKTGPYTATKTINSYKKGTKLTSVAIVKNGYGNVWYKLSDGYYVYESYVTVHNSHTWNSGSITKSATCTADGTRKYTCTLCGATKTTAITKLGHKWNSGQKTKSPTCSATGTMKYTCVRCSVTKTESIAKVSHNYDTKTFMCTYGCGKCNPNSITVTSTAKNTLYVHTDVTSKTGPYTATKTINSYKKGTKLTSVAIVKNGYGNVWYKLSDGYYVYESYVTVHNSHTWNSGSITKSATCTADGTKKYTCTLCGATKTATITKLGHKWNSGKKTKSPTCSATGTMLYTCVRCGVTKTTAIAKLAHNYDTKTNLCTYGCGTYNPSKIKTVSTVAFTGYVITDKSNIKKGPSSSCTTMYIYNRSAKIFIVATVKNAEGESWYKLNSGYYILASTAEKASIKTSGSTSVAKGQSKQINITVVPSISTITWTSSDTSVATISSSGVVTGKKTGNCIITAKTTIDGSVYSVGTIVKVT